MREQQRLIIFLPTSSTIPLENEIIMEAAQRSGRRLSWVKYVTYIIHLFQFSINGII